MSPEISLGDLGQLPFRANVALALRSAARLERLFRLDPQDKETPAHQEIWKLAITHATNFALAKPFSLDDAAEVAQAAYLMADATSFQTQYAGYAAAHAVQTAVHAARAGLTEEKGWRMQVVGASFGALRVFLKNADAATDEVYRATLWADMEALRRLIAEPGFSPQAALDPSETGPLGTLWPAGVPNNFGNPLAGMPGFPMPSVGRN